MDEYSDGKFYQESIILEVIKEIFKKSLVLIYMPFVKKLIKDSGLDFRCTWGQ